MPARGLRERFGSVHSEAGEVSDIAILYLARTFGVTLKALRTRLEQLKLVAPTTLRRIDEAFDGHTIDGICQGEYRMDDGTMVKDKSLKVWVALAPDRVDELRLLGRRFAKELKQESIYFEVTDAEVEFLRPLPED